LFTNSSENAEAAAARWAAAANDYLAAALNESALVWSVEGW
jgi:hypothetical protein